MKDTSTEKEKIDSILAFIFLRSLLSPITKTKAFKLKLVNKDGVLIKTPETEKERDALTSLDRLSFKLKRLLGSKLSNLYSYNYIKTSEEKTNRLVQSKSSAERKAVVNRLKTELNQLTEKYDFNDFNDILVELISENIEELKNAKSID